MSGFLSSLFGSAENHDSKKLVRSKRLHGRSLRMESLEERPLLSVAPADLAAIQDLFPDYEIADNTNYIEVTSTVDSGAGSLRDAVAQAGQTVEDDIIVVRQPSIDLLQTLQINIDAGQFGSVTIVGLTDSVAGLTNLSSNSQFQVVSVGAGTELNLGHLNISGGKAAAGQNGGGIAAVDAVLNISDVRFRSNATTGVDYYEYGGAIYQQGGHSTLDNVTFISNSSVHGAAMAVVNGTTDQTNVVYQGNKAYDASVECYGGGLYAEGSNVTLENAVFNRNEALIGSALMLHSSVSTITGATITQNSGNQAIYVTKHYTDTPPAPSSVLNLRNSIVLGNINPRSDRGLDIGVNMGTPNFENNIVGGYSSNFQIDAESNRLGQYTAADVFNITENSYITLRDGSPAVNVGDNSYVTTTRDARGNNRVQQGTVDLGAVESKFTGEPLIDLPDLVPFAPDGWESPLIVAADPSSLQDVDLFEPGQNLFVSLALKNAGTVLATNDFKVELLLDGEVIREYTYPAGLPVDYVLWQRGITIYGLNVGEHTLQLRLDTLGAVAEIDETNNMLTKTFRVAGPQADLTPFAPDGWTAPIVFAGTDYGIVDAEIIRPHETFFVSWGMTNIGDIQAQNGFQVTLLIDGQEYWSNSYPPGLPVDYFLQYRGIQVNGLAAGEHEFELRIDSYNDVNESDETNNVFTRTLTIVEPLADFTVTTPDGWDSPIQLRQDYDGATPDRLLAGHPTFLNAAIINRGNAYAEAFVEVRVDGNWAGSFNIYGLEPGQTLISPDIQLYLGPGEHRIELVIDPYNYVTESDETNNLYSTTVFVDRLRPDFVLENYDPLYSAVEFWQYWQYGNGGGNDFIADEWIELRYTVTNLAGYAEKPVAVGVYVDGTLYDTQWFDIPMAYSYYTTSVYLAGLGVGEHEIEIRIDPDNLIAEENEANNIYSTTINIVAPDLVAAELVLSSTPGATEDDAMLVSGSPIFVNWSVLNVGVDTQRNFNVELFLNGTFIFGQAFYDELPNGAELSRVFDNLYGGLQPGEYVFELRVNPNGQLTESDFSNNVLTKTITVVQRIPQVENLNAWLSGETEIVVEWYADEFDGLAFEVQRSIAGSGRWENVGDGGQFGPYWSFSDVDIASGTTYEYRVVGYAPDGQSTVSDTVTLETPALPDIAAPDGLSASVRSSSQIDVAWDAVDGATSYRLERAVSGSNNWTTVYQGTATEFSNTGLAANTIYVYRVAAIDGSVASEYSTPITAQTQKSGTAAVPTSVQSTAATKNSITVSWGGDKSNVTEYIVQWSEDGMTWKSATVKKNTTSHTITGLMAGTEYLVRVAANSKAGQSGWSDPLSVQTVAIPPKPLPPTGLTLVAKTSSTATISWTAPASELTGYRIEYSFNGNSWSSVTVGAGVTETTLTGLKSNKTYTIRIVALNGEVLSEYSSPLTV